MNNEINNTTSSNYNPTNNEATEQTAASNIDFSAQSEQTSADAPACNQVNKDRFAYEQNRTTAYSTPVQPAQRPPYNIYGAQSGSMNYQHYSYANNGQGAGSYYNAPRSQPGVLGGYGNSSAQYHTAPDKREKKPASKGFVVALVALGMVISMAFGFFASALYYSVIDKTGAPGGTINVVYDSTDKNVPVTEKGVAAYVTSVAANTVVEVRTETAVNDSYFGQYVKEGAGSGVILSSGSDGTYILTCAHVIEGATTVKVITRDGTEYTATFHSGDAQTDIGIIKINVSGLPTAKIADFSKVVVGEEVIAIGNPLGELGGSVTNGIVSALERDVIIDGSSYRLLQTNAELSPGTSGGGLFNASGSLIGIVSSGIVGESIEGIGFAIPINDAIEIAEELIKNGYVTGRVKLGVSLIEVYDEEDVYYYWQYRKYFTEYGIYIIESEDKALKLGDRLIAIDSITVQDFASLKSMLLEYKVGDVVSVTVSRLNSKGKSEIVTVQITLTEKTN